MNYENKLLYLELFDHLYIDTKVLNILAVPPMLVPRSDTYVMFKRY